MKRIYSIALSAALLLGFGSCSKELDNTAGPDNGASAFQFSVKTVKGNLVTYAEIAQGAEWTVGNVDIYLFDAATGAALGNKSNFDYDATDKVFTAKSAWLATNKGKKVNVYFVGNDDTANLFGGTTHVGTVTNEAAFIEKLSVAQTLDGGKANLLTTPLLFSAYELGVQVPNLGKLSVPVTLKRREARFDIVVTDTVGFKVTKILVSDAKRQGFIFGNATTSPTLPVASLKEITPKAYDAAEPTPLMPSVFYMYPTQLGTGKTEIVILGIYKGVDQEFKVNSTAQIEANKRYKLVFNAAELEFDLVVADYEEGGSMPVDPLEAGTLSVASVTGGKGSWDTNYYQLAPDPATQTLTVTLNVPTAAGATAAAAGVVGGSVVTGITPGAAVLTYGYGYEQTFTVKVSYTTEVADTKTTITFTDASDATKTLAIDLEQRLLTYAFGDYYPDKNATFSSPGVLSSGKMPIGIVTYVDPIDPSHGSIIGLQYAENLAWTNYYGGMDKELFTNDSLPGGTAILSMDTIQTKYGPDFNDFPAFKYVHELNPAGQTYDLAPKGVWYLPSSGEFSFMPSGYYAPGSPAGLIFSDLCAKGNMAVAGHPLFATGTSLSVILSNEAKPTSYADPEIHCSSVYISNVYLAWVNYISWGKMVQGTVIPFMNF